MSWFLIDLLGQIANPNSINSACKQCHVTYHSLLHISQIGLVSFFPGNMSNSVVTANGGGYNSSNNISNSSTSSNDKHKYKESYSPRETMDYATSFSSRDTKSYTSRDRNSYGAPEPTKEDTGNGQPSASAYQSSFSDSR